MPILSELMKTAGVVAAGEFTYKGELARHLGKLSEPHAQMAAELCLANTTSINMQAEIYCLFDQSCGIRSVPGWIVRGNDFSVCAIGNYFCFVENRAGTLNQVAKIMRDWYDHMEVDPLVYLYEKTGGDVHEKLF